MSVDGASMPDREQLPAVLHALARRNAVQLDHQRFHADADHLITGIRKLTGTMRGTPSPKEYDPTTTDTDWAPFGPPASQPTDDGQASVSGGQSLRWPALASYGRRVGSAMIDILLGLAMFYVPILLWAGLGDPIGFVVAASDVAFVILNVGYLQGTTGQSIGKRALGIKLVGAANGQPVGFWLAIGRLFAHLIDVISFGIGFLSQTSGTLGIG